MNVLDRLELGWSARLPMRLQTEAAECGLACLAMIAGYYGYSSDLPELRRRLAVSLKGVNLKGLVAMADRIGFASRPVRLELDELKQLKTPCILHWDLNHFVVLKQVAGQHILIHDPAAGVRRLGLAEASRHFTGVALELTPTGGYEPATSAPRVRWRSLLGRMVGLKQTLGQLFLLALALELFSVVSPFFLQWVVDHALVTADRDLLVTLALGFTLLLLLKTAVAAMRGWMLITIGAVETVLDGVLAAVTLGIMFLFAPELTALVLAGTVFYGVLRWTFYPPLRQASMEAIVWSARRDSHFLETLRGIKTIKLFNGQEGRRAYWLNLLVESINRQLTTQNLRLAFKIVNALLIGGLAILIIWLGAQRVLENQMSIGMLLAFITYKDQFLGRVSNLIDKGVDLIMLRLHAERLADIALAAPEPREQS